MARAEYYETIISILKGEPYTAQGIPPDRLDWEGPGALLELYEKADASAREKIVYAMGQIIELHEAPPEVIAEIIYMAATLDLVQIEPQVRHLHSKKEFSEWNILSDAITTYLTIRELSINPPSP
jgi:hypothetical protein